ncbi:MBL fold metallo-hydrolase [Paenibacillus sp. FSL R7-0313]|uniref:MBL fold metallo-hydrolase n=1 Tax=Paenibacillus sp. FSL R7-0313 TaxID=2954532 RepID=UPI0030D7605A
MPRFIAFKFKNNGESFYIETIVNKRRKTILVDGGEGGELANHFTKVVRRDKVNVVVCTHQDSDHSRGIRTFLSEYNCDEVWLPAEWGYLYGYLFNKDAPDITDTFQKLISLLQVFEDMERESVFRKKYFGEYLTCQIETMKEEIHSFDEFDLAEFSNLERYSKVVLMELEISNLSFSDLSKDAATWISETIGHYKNIVKIATIALEKGIQIRWFEYRKDAPLIIHKEDPLIALNSKEVLRMKRFKSSTEFLLQLVSQSRKSVTNQRCLVFSTNWKNKKTPPILLTADSYLEGKEVDKAKFKRGMIITVPHHGSKNNKDAFDKIKSKIESHRIDRTKWIKSYHSKAALDSWYLRDILEIKGGTKRYCTKCENEHIEFKSIKREWKRIKAKKRRDGCKCTSK